jgi:uncharacterized protein YjaZ
MPVDITFFDRKSEISASEKTLIREKCLKAVSNIEYHMKLKDIDILILCTDNFSLDQYSFTGMAISPHIVKVHVSPKIETLAGDIEQFFQSFIIHELHHCLRWPYFKKTIGEAIVLEGMAMNAESFLGFEEKQLGQISKQETSLKLNEAYKDIANLHDNSWIYYLPESGDSSFPWIYHLGQEIVGRAFQKKGWNPFSQINLSAEEIFAAAKSTQTKD